ncbi:DNA primase [Tichowtungia aerotolerans]|uniref:DNA primase n=1 Tax=Tichowtungia aerotolerans TaxID=2697043 RepID=A0A6P1M7Q5_9BACT|nr:DNA primase [Tichowtungia aerotolerans]QHI68208.1 DNA primase [Tichowtungia aerotolerans]
MKQIPRETIDEIRSRNDIVDVIGSYLSLKNAGGRFKALCPFHKEKTPSFTISPDRQIYHCFGCDAGGDVIRFVQEYEKVDFLTALQMLADRVGMELNFEDGDGRSSNKRELFRIHEGVAQLYHKILLEHPEGEAGRAYLMTRNLKPETVEAFNIGFAPDRFDALEKWAAHQNVPSALMEEAGLTARSERGSVYDRFRKRLMFPILDEAGRVIGFSGRLIDPNDRGGKYVNSPETPLFRKSRVLFGIDKARRAMADKRTAIVVEGQLDCIRCHEAGVTNVVASQGTALTSDHGRMIRRYADEVILVLDADAAGQKAALRSSEAFIAEELSVRVASLPAGEDPDSLILSQGPDAFMAKVNSAVSALDFLIDTSAKTENLRTDAGLMRTSRAVQNLIACASGAVQRDRMVQRAAERLGLSQSALRRDMSRHQRRTVTPAKSDVSESKPVAVQVSHPPVEVALTQLLCLYHEEVFPVVADHLPPEYVTDSDCRLVYELLLDDSQNLLERIPEGRAAVQKLAVRIQMEDSRLLGKDASPAAAAQDVVMKLWRSALKARRQRTDQIEERVRLTMQLKQLDLGWAHAVQFMVV